MDATGNEGMEDLASGRWPMTNSEAEGGWYCGAGVNLAVGEGLPGERELLAKQASGGSITNTKC